MEKTTSLLMELHQPNVTIKNLKNNKKASSQTSSNQKINHHSKR